MAACGTAGTITAAERAAIPGILDMRTSNAIAFGVSAANGREKVLLITETRAESGPEVDEIAKIAAFKVRNELDIPLPETVLVQAAS